MDIKKIKRLCTVFLLVLLTGCAARPAATPAGDMPVSASSPVASPAGSSTAKPEKEPALPEEKSVSSSAETERDDISSAAADLEETTSSPAEDGASGSLGPVTDEEKAYLEEYFLSFAKDYSIVTLDILFSSPCELTDTEKYTLFLFLQSRPREDGTSLEQELYSEKEQACIVPLPVVNSYLQEYLGIGISDPELAASQFAENYKYDAKRDAFIVPSLSGFGGYRDFELLGSELKGDILTLSIGSFNPDASPDAPPDKTFRMRIRLSGLKPLRFQLLSWEKIQG